MQVIVQAGWEPEIPHYANTPMQYTAIFYGCKDDNLQMKNRDIFLSFAQNIDFGYMCKTKKMYTPVNPSFTI